MKPMGESKNEINSLVSMKESFKVARVNKVIADGVY